MFLLDVCVFDLRRFVFRQQKGVWVFEQRGGGESTVLY